MRLRTLAGPRQLVTALVLLGTLVALAGCNSGGPGKRGEAFRQCMSEHGVTLPEHQKGTSRDTPPPGVDPAAFQAARDACAKK